MSHKILPKILSNRIIKHLGDTNNFDLIETKKDATLKKVTLLNLPNNTVILKPDDISTNTLFNVNSIGDKRCDYLIISDNDVFFIELKSHPKAYSNKLNECKNKFKATRCLLVYIDEVLSDLHEYDKIFESRDRHYILLYKGVSIDIKSSSRKPIKSYQQPMTTPEDPRAISVENNGRIYLNELKTSGQNISLMMP